MIDSPSPTRESFELAAKLCGSPTTPDLILAEAHETVKLCETMLSVDCFSELAFSLHRALHHSPAFIRCEANISGLVSIMAQMFAYGYAAGRQEVIDQELARMGMANR
ncbi:MAG: hypothetical protein WAM58_08150 [Candidatus Acidiferrum sp.]